MEACADRHAVVLRRSRSEECVFDAETAAERAADVIKRSMVSVMNENLVVFVCEHGAAKSVIAATLFNKAAREASAPFRAIARGTDPDEEITPGAVAGLSAEGLRPDEVRPTALAQSDIDRAAHVVWFGDPPPEFGAAQSAEQWKGVPAFSDGYRGARESIGEHVDALLQRLTTPRP